MPRVALLALLFACSGSDKGTTDDTRVVTDPTRTGTTGASGVGTTTTGQTYWTGDVADCTADYSGNLAAPGSGGLPECVVEELTCGSVVYGTTAGGTTEYEWQFWLDQMELDSLTNEATTVLDGPDRVCQYREHANGEVLVVRVWSCDDTWISWRRHGDVGDEFCDEGHYSEAGHFVWMDGGWEYTFQNAAAGTYDWEFIVDTFGGTPGNFVVTLDCY